MEPRISVVIAAYRPGRGFDRVMASLDAQTLPQSEFETIVIDDGSPDDTLQRLSAFAGTRANMRVRQIEHTGWPSRPRNVGTAMARGTWVLFMDHDDSLYPEALQRMADFAAETGADVLSPKESKTSDIWWGGAALRGRNVPNAAERGGIDDLLPMVPHKLYRREFLDRHEIRFPEGGRRLWEDIYVNVEAWRHAEHVAVLGDTPAYLWHAGTANSSRSYGPRDVEYWDRLDDLFEFIDTTLDDPAHARDRRSALLHQYRGRVLSRLSKALRGAPASVAQMGLERARRIQQRYVPEEWDASLGKHLAARAVLLRLGRADLLEALWSVDRDLTTSVTAEAVQWRDGMLRVELTAAWRYRSGASVRLHREGDRLVRELPPSLLAALPGEVVDLSGSLRTIRMDVGARDRIDNVTWLVGHEGRPHWDELDDDHLTPVFTATATLDPHRAAAGEPLRMGPHDLAARLTWESMLLSSPVRYTGRSAPAMLGSLPAVAYRSKRSTLALDLGATLRNPAGDGGAGRVSEAQHRITVPLPRVRTFGSGAVAAAIRLEPADGSPATTLEGTLHANADGARLVLPLKHRLRSGDYQASFRVGEGPFVGRRAASVRAGVLTLQPPERKLPASTGARRLLGGLRRRIGV